MSGVCNCDESLELRAELKIVRAERDYMLTGLSPTEIRVMRQELAKEWELEMGWPAGAEDLGPLEDAKDA